MKLPKIRRLPSGNYTCQLRIDGQSVSITEPLEALCAARAMAYKSGLLKAKNGAEAIILREACKRYVAAKKSRLSPSTVQGYNKIIANAFPALMDKKITALSRSALQRGVDEECGRISRRGKKVSAKTVVSEYLFIASVLHYFDESIDTSVKLPEIKQKPVFILTPEEIYGAVKNTDIELPVLLSMWLSFTVSEMRGLTKSRSIYNGKITVTETVVDIGGEPVRKEEAKEEKRARTLDIPPYIQTLIDKVDGDVIVPLSGQALYKRFSRALEAAGLPHMSFHQLRHVNASVMADLNVPENIANERGGWKTSYVRQRVYTHTFSNSRLEADKQINAVFEAVVNGKNANENANENATPLEPQRV